MCCDVMCCVVLCCAVMCCDVMCAHAFYVCFGEPEANLLVFVLFSVLTAILSRQTAGVVGHSLVLNLPGKPGAIRTCLGAVMPAIPHVRSHELTRQQCTVPPTS